MVAIAQQLHYKRIALAFGNDIGSQTFIQPAINALKKAGITLTTNQSLDLKATTFRTEAEAIIQSHPDAIMTEALGSADPTLLSEITQLNSGNGVPGATVCYSFAACASALKAGTSIRYEGPGGPTNFDSFHDSTGIFQVDTYSPSGQVNVVGNLTAAQLRALAG